jgi:hypothetical protein
MDALVPIWSNGGRGFRVMHAAEGGEQTGE